jgi:hypothetical protein
MISIFSVKYIIPLLLVSISCSQLCYGDVRWTTDGVGIVTEINNQWNHSSATDGVGGAIITWKDFRSNTQIYAQRVDSDGNTLWVLNGVPVYTTSLVVSYIRIVTDGQGGAIISWLNSGGGGDNDIKAQRIDANGNILWGPSGIDICNATGFQSSPNIISDGSGGAIITWRDERASYPRIYSQRVDQSGNTLWTANGNVVFTTTNSLDAWKMVSDGLGGAIIVCERSDTPWYEIYAQRIDSNGNTIWAPNGINISDGPLHQFFIDATADVAGGAYIIWDSNSDQDLHAQRIDNNGNKYWGVDGLGFTLGQTSLERIATCDSGGFFLSYRTIV